MEVAIYREGSDGAKSFWQAEFILNGVAYIYPSILTIQKISTLIWISFWANRRRERTQSGAALTSVLGFDVCRIEMEETGPHQYMWHYYVKLDGKDVCVAEQFGYDGPEAWSRDLDGDGVPELICSGTYGDGAQIVIVCRNHSGIIEKGTVRWAYYEERFGWNYLEESVIPSGPVEQYNPERGVFIAADYAANGYDNPIVVEFDDGLEPFEFFAFSH